MFVDGSSKSQLGYNCSVKNTIEIDLIKTNLILYPRIWHKKYINKLDEWSIMLLNYTCESMVNFNNIGSAFVLFSLIVVINVIKADRRNAWFYTILYTII